MKKEKLTNRMIKAGETRNKIFETANRLIRQHGIESVSVDSIVEEAGVSKGAFYVHFDSKDSLVAALFSQYAAELDLGYKSYLESIPSNMSAADTLVSFAEKIADTITDTVGYDHIKTLYKVQIVRTIKIDAIVGYDRDLYQLFSELLQKGVEQGEFTAELPVDLLTNHFIMSVRGLTYEWCIRYPNLDLKEQVRDHFRLLLNGIRKH